MIPIIRHNIDAIAEKHYSELKSIIEARINGRGGLLISFILSNLKVILSGNPLQLKNEIIDKIPPVSRKNKKELKKIFDYKNFTSRVKYGPYKLAQSLNVKTCPYCNRQYTFTLDSKTGKTRPEFDHFYDQDTYPYLALSFYNLIPSCHICNSNLKNTKQFCIATHIHPYIENYINEAKFKVKLKNGEKPSAETITEKYGVSFFYGSLDAFELKLRVLSPLNAIQEKANRNINDFRLEELYNEHKDYVVELIQKSIIYSKSYIDDLVKSYPELFRDSYDVKRMIMSNYIYEEDLGKRVLSKLTKDILEEFSLDLV